jgi:hypothetical protein
MAALLVILVVAIALSVALAPPRYRGLLVGLGLGALVVAGGGIAFLRYVPRDLLVRHPALTGILHPYRAVLWIALGLVSGTGILLGVLGRIAFRRLFPGRVAAGSHGGRR